MSCSICGSPAVYYYRESKLKLCRKHFVEGFEARVRETIEKFGLLKGGDRVAVAVSGGKDSLTTLYLLEKLSAKLGVEVFGLAIDEGIKGYREYKLEALMRFSQKIGVEVYVARFSEYFGSTLDRMVEMLRERGFVYKPCTVCGVLRRYLVNRVARELGATKVATGHNLDDEIQVFVMNFLRGGLVNIARESVLTGLYEHPELVPRIKPLYFCREREVLAYSLVSGIETPFVECPYVIHSMRHKIRRWLNRLERERPGSKERILALKHLVAELLCGTEYSRGEIRTCRECGEPASGEVCKACSLRSYLRLQP